MAQRLKKSGPEQIWGLILLEARVIRGAGRRVNQPLMP